MARRKTLPESLRAKLALAERLAMLRLELFGERGGPEMARRLGIPVRTWYNYEGGVTVPAEVVLRIMELTSVEPVWLLHGRGPRFRQLPRSDGQDSATKPAMTVGALLRTALQLLENEEPSSSRARENLTDFETAGFEPPAAPPRERSCLKLSKKIAASRSVATPCRRSLPTGRQSPSPITMKTLGSSMARWSSSGWTISPRSDGFATADATPCFAPRIPRQSHNSSSSNSRAAPNDPGSAASCGSTLLTESLDRIPLRIASLVPDPE